jgi:hypothetical protein
MGRKVPSDAIIAASGLSSNAIPAGKGPVKGSPAYWRIKQTQPGWKSTVIDEKGTRSDRQVDDDYTAWTTITHIPETGYLSSIITDYRDGRRSEFYQWLNYTSTIIFYAADGSDLGRNDHFPSQAELDSFPPIQRFSQSREKEWNSRTDRWETPPPREPVRARSKPPPWNPPGRSLEVDFSSGFISREEAQDAPEFVPSPDDTLIRFQGGQEWLDSFDRNGNYKPPRTDNDIPKGEGPDLVSPIESGTDEVRKDWDLGWQVDESGDRVVDNAYSDIPIWPDIPKY